MYQIKRGDEVLIEARTRAWLVNFISPENIEWALILYKTDGTMRQSPEPYGDAPLPSWPDKIIEHYVKPQLRPYGLTIEKVKE